MGDAGKIAGHAGAEGSLLKPRIALRRVQFPEMLMGVDDAQLGHGHAVHNRNVPEGEPAAGAGSP